MIAIQKLIQLNGKQGDNVKFWRMGEDFKVELNNINGLFLLFVWGFTSHSKIYCSHGDVAIIGEGLQNLTLLGTHGHGVVRVLWRATPIGTRVIRL